MSENFYLESIMSEKFPLEHEKVEIGMQKIAQNEGLRLALNYMLECEAEPKLVEFPDGKVYLVELSQETPLRRNLCYDEEARLKRKKNAPLASAKGIAEQYKLELLTESEYYFLQESVDLDLKTSSWLDTPKEVRKLGGAIFGDKRYAKTFIYHNGADSYYGVRGVRYKLEVL